MDKRKKLVKLFYEIDDFIRQKSIKSDAYTFLLNRFWLALNNKRSAAERMFGITKGDFSLLNNEFSHRLSKKFVSSLSITSILSLPTEKVAEISNIKVQPRQSVLVLADTLVLPYEIEKKVQLFIGFTGRNLGEIPFKNVEFYPVSRSTNLSISIQSTLLDLLSGDFSQLKPISVDFILEDSVNFSFPNENFLETLSFLLKPEASLYLCVKKIFLSTPLTKKDKKTLYSFFEIDEINRFSEFLQLKLLKKGEGLPVAHTNFVKIKDFTSGKTIELERQFLDSNHLFTFNDGVSAEQLSLAAKIEARAGSTCGDYFRFFLGMFRKGPIDELIEPFRRSVGYQPLVSAKEIVPFQSVIVKKYLFLNRKFFFQMPSKENFEQKKLLLRYLSVKPVVAYDDQSLYFLNDAAAIVPRSDEVDFFFAEGYLNSKLVEFFYKIRFPHNNKFLKKNFNKIPFMFCSGNMQKIISDLVLQIRDLKANLVLSKDKEGVQKEIERLCTRLDNFIYQFFKLSQDEIRIIEQFVCENSDSTEA